MLAVGAVLLFIGEALSMLLIMVPLPFPSLVNGHDSFEKPFRHTSRRKSPLGGCHADAFIMLCTACLPEALAIPRMIGIKAFLENRLRPFVVAHLMSSRWRFPCQRVKMGIWIIRQPEVARR